MRVDREDLARTFERFEMPEPAFERLVDRRERRHRRERIKAGIAAFVIVAATAAVLARSFVSTPVPADRSGPPWTTADVDGVIFENPGGWHLTAIFPGKPGKVALMNFAPNLATTDPCTGMPSDGAILRIRSGGPPQPPWPVALSADDSASDLACDGEHLHAAWSVSRREYEAEVTFGPNVSDRDRTDLVQAFSALTFAAEDRAVKLPNDSFEMALHPFMSEVVGAETAGSSPWTMFGTTISGVGVGITVLTPGGLRTGLSIPPVDSSGSISDIKLGSRTLLAGVVGARVARVGIETIDGQTFDSPLVAPPGLFPGGDQVYVAPFESLAAGLITTYDASGTPLQAVRFTPGMGCADNPSECLPQIATGQTIVASFPFENVGWTLRERGAEIQLLDHEGTVMGSVAAGDHMLATTVPLPTSRLRVVFGVVPSGTTLVLRHIAGVGWGIMSTAQLEDGTTVFWAETRESPVRDTLGNTLAVAAVDGSCHAIAAVDPATGDPTTVPTDHACLDSNGGG